MKYSNNTLREKIIKSTYNDNCRMTTIPIIMMCFIKKKFFFPKIYYYKLLYFAYGKLYSGLKRTAILIVTEINVYLRSARAEKLDWQVTERGVNGRLKSVELSYRTAK